MDTKWESLDAQSQLVLARQALDRAIVIVAGRAEMLASQLETGAMADYGGADALRLFATLTRGAGAAGDNLHGQLAYGQIGHA